MWCNYIMTVISTGCLDCCVCLWISTLTLTLLSAGALQDIYFINVFPLNRSHDHTALLIVRTPARKMMTGEVYILYKQGKRLLRWLDKNRIWSENSLIAYPTSLCPFLALSVNYSAFAGLKAQFLCLTHHIIYYHFSEGPASGEINDLKEEGKMLA